MSVYEVWKAGQLVDDKEPNNALILATSALTKTMPERDTGS